jgi:hypothetical protein
LPAGGAAGGAFYKVQDGFADTSGLRHNFRIVMAESDRQFLFLNTNRMSNDLFAVTVIEDESTVYYDVGLRLKASASGRYGAGGYGFNISFQPDALFRGVHSTVAIERTNPSRELFSKHMINRAGGGYWSFYDDVAHIITPTAGDRGLGLLALARHTSTFFDDLFPDAGESGTLFNHELLYNPDGTTGGPEGLKIGNPYDLADRGTGREPYRWGFQIRSDRARDDYSQMVALNQSMSLTGAALQAALDPLIDVDQWMRTFALASLTATPDTYGRVWEHNIRYYVRPTDGKIIVFPWDLDGAFSLATNASVTPTSNNIVKLFSLPTYRRLFDGHLNDMIQTTFNSTYASPWAASYGALTGLSFAAYTSHISSRGTYALGTLPAPVGFQITTNGGSNFSVAASNAELVGNGWIDVFGIQVNGIAVPVEWTDADSWSIRVPLAIGVNPLTITAFNNRGTEVGSDTITVTNTSTIDLADASNTIISELHYHPADPIPLEVAEGYTDADLFEFVEITNTHPSSYIDLTNVSFEDGVEFDFPPGITLAPGAQIVVVANQAAFEFRYGSGTAIIAGVYIGNFRNSGEHVRLEAANDAVIADFTYGDGIPWPAAADGSGYSLVFGGSDPTEALDWRSSTMLGGNPGSSDSVAYGGGDLLAYGLAADPMAAKVGADWMLDVRINLAADEVLVLAQFSTDLVNWSTATSADLISRTNHGDGTATLSFLAPFAASVAAEQYARVLVEAR